MSLVDTEVEIKYGDGGVRMERIPGAVIQRNFEKKR
jgi:hypothetical protein